MTQFHPPKKSFEGRYSPYIGCSIFDGLASWLCQLCDLLISFHFVFRQPVKRVRPNLQGVLVVQLSKHARRQYYLHAFTLGLYDIHL
jgi:hypothetical protein